MLPTQHPVRMALLFSVFLNFFTNISIFAVVSNDVERTAPPSTFS